MAGLMAHRNTQGSEGLLPFSSPLGVLIELGYWLGANSSVPQGSQLL